MLYLVKGYGKDGPLLKIGFTDNWDKRSQGYITHQPDYELLGTREGDMRLETYFKRKLKKFQYKKQSEWMKYNQDIIDLFNNHFPTEEEISTTVGVRVEVYLRQEFGNPTMKELNITIEDGLPKEVKDFATEFNNSGSHFPKRILCCCNFIKLKPEYIDYIPDFFKKYIKFLGVDYIISMGGYKYKLEQAIFRLGGFSSIFSKEDLENIVTGYFQIGQKYTKSQIKQDLQEIYTKLGIPDKATSLDLEKWFDIRSVKITNKESGKRDHGFEIIKLKQS